MPRRAFNNAKPGNGIVLSADNGGLTGVIRSWQYSDSTTAADPGSNYLRFSHADPESGDTLYISDIDGHDADLGGLLTSLVAGTRLQIRSANAPSQFIIIELGTNTDNTDWHSIAYTLIAGAPNFLDDETLVVEIGFAGATGDIGGLAFTFESETSAPPSASSIRANNADLSAATKLYIDDDTLGGVDVSATLIALDPGSKSEPNRIRLTVGSTDVIFDVDGTTDQTGYVEIDVSGHDGATALDVGTARLNIEWSGANGSGDLLADGTVPMTAALDTNGNGVILDADGDSSIGENADDLISVTLGGEEKVFFDGPANELRIDVGTDTDPAILRLVGDDDNEVSIDSGYSGFTTSRIVTDRSSFRFYAGTTSEVYRFQTDRHQQYVSNAEAARLDSTGYKVGGTNATPAQSNVAGSILRDEGGAEFSTMGAVPVLINRGTNDGTLVSLRQAGTEEGSLDVSGTAVSLTGAHLSRLGQSDADAPLRGTVMANVDELAELLLDEWTENIEAVTETYEKLVTVPVKKMQIKVEIEDGNAVVRQKEVTRDEPTYEEFPMVDDKGRTVLQRGKDGKTAPKMYRKPVTETVTETTTPAQTIQRRDRYFGELKAGDTYTDEAGNEHRIVAKPNEQLTKLAVSAVDGDRNVAGVFDRMREGDVMLAQSGDFVIRIGARTTIQMGDLLTSAGNGTAKPQADDVIRSSTVAKVIATQKVAEYDDGSYLVPCVLMVC